jgi:hypothetical protein
MRSNYPLSSLELNDKLFLMYENMVSLLGFDDYDCRISGKLEVIEASGNTIMYSNSGIPHIGVDEIYGGVKQDASFSRIRSYLKTDYIYKKYYNKISYSE